MVFEMADYRRTDQWPNTCSAEPFPCLLQPIKITAWLPKANLNPTNQYLTRVNILILDQCLSSPSFNLMHKLLN